MLKKVSNGFTIVELLIVIVVIAILAAISIIAYNGIQQRAENTKTINAVVAWSKAIQSYKADGNSISALPGSCLGKDLLYGPNATSDSTQIAQCRQDNATAFYASTPSFYTMLSGYIQNTPTPSEKVTMLNSATVWYRGAHYTGGSTPRIDFVLMGSSTECPTISGLTFGTKVISTTTNTVRCTNSIN